MTGANPVTYEVWVDSQSGFTAPVDVIYTGLTSTSKNWKPPLPDGVKYWKVRAVNFLDVPGAWSSTRSFTVDTVVPPAPALSAPANFAPGIYFTPTFSWAAATGANAYMFEYDNNLDFRQPGIHLRHPHHAHLPPNEHGRRHLVLACEIAGCRGQLGSLERVPNPRDPASGGQERGI